MGRALAVWKEELRALTAGLCDRELARTREWFERAGLPKATRVAQRETYNLLRAHGLIAARARDGGRVGENVEAHNTPPLFTREESVRLYAAYAAEVLGVSLSDYLDEYVSRGEMTIGEAQAALLEARELGLSVDSRPASGSPCGGAAESLL